MKNLDLPPPALTKIESLRDGITLFNQERFWESHEALEQVWRITKGAERDALQSLILTAAAFVHFQKGELDICLSVLRRARTKMIHGTDNIPIDFDKLRMNVDTLLASERIRPFEL